MAVLHVLSTLLLVVGLVTSHPTGDKDSQGPVHSDGVHPDIRLARPPENASPTHPYGPLSPPLSGLPRNLAALNANRGPWGPRPPQMGGPMRSMPPQMGGPMGSMPPQMGRPMGSMPPQMGGPMGSMAPQMGGRMGPMAGRGPMGPMGFQGNPGGMMPPRRLPNSFPFPGQENNNNNNNSNNSNNGTHMVMTPMGPIMVPSDSQEGPQGDGPQQPSPEQIRRMMMMRQMMLMEMARRQQMAQQGDGSMGMGPGGPMPPTWARGPSGPMMPGLEPRVGSEEQQVKDGEENHEAGPDSSSGSGSRLQTLRDLILAARNREMQRRGMPITGMGPDGMPPMNMPPQTGMPPYMPHQTGMPPHMPPVNLASVNMPPQTSNVPPSYVMAGHVLGDDVDGNNMPMGDPSSSNINGVPGPVTLPVKDLGSLMEFEYNLQHVRSQLLKSFYTDLIAYRTITQQIQKRMVAKLAMIHVVESRMAMPLRGTIAMGISPPAYSN